jgi:hypothetical protein
MLGRSRTRRAAAPPAAAAAPAVAIPLDYPVTPRPRFGHGLPTHEGLHRILDEGRDRYRAHLQAVLAHRERLLAIGMTEPAGSEEPHWRNGFLPGLDAAALYTFVADGNPSTYLEVGSGTSTKFTRRAIRDHSLRTRIVSIDPQPRAEVDAICDEVVRAPLEDVDLSVFDQLDAGDILFVDNSHRVLPNSDATVVFLEVLPRLRSGVLVQIHDIFLPDDYPDWATERFYSEQYVLAAFLLGGGLPFTTELPAWFVATDPELQAMLNPLWEEPSMDGVQRHGGSYWLRIR